MVFEYTMIAAPSSGGTYLRTFLQTNFKEGFCLDFHNKFGFKTMAHHLNPIAERFLKENPDRKIIHLIRDGRDSVGSRLSKNHDDADWEIFKELLPKENPDDKYSQLEKLSHLWVLYIESAIKLRKNKNYLEIKYEDYCKYPIKTIRKIEHFLEQKNPGAEQAFKKGVFQNRIGLYKENKELDLNVIKPIIESTMKKVGYSWD